jgi:two-component system sensor histidine kinase/response regulator
MDVQMPEMDGLTATTRIREQEKQTNRHVPIIAMTAHAMRGDRERCIEAGMDDYVSKPISAATLLEAIYRVVPIPSREAQPQRWNHWNRWMMPANWPRFLRRSTMMAHFS